MTFTKTIVIVFFVFNFILIDVFFFNNRKESNLYVSLDNTSNMDTIFTGEQLANIYCKICHQFPKPELLDKNTWVNLVLPDMALRLGIKKPGVDPYKGIPEEEIHIIRPLGVYPEKAVLSNEQWNKIVEYYKEEAPLMPIDQKLELTTINKLPLFRPKHVFVDDKPFPMTTLLKFDKSTSKLFVGDANNEVYMIDKQLKLKKTWKVTSAPVDIDFPLENSPRILTIGKFNPSDQKLGSLQSLGNKNADKYNIYNLPRPVNFESGDLNGDNIEDVVICGFGNNSGKLFWLDGFDPNKEHLLKNAPGARKAEIFDFNKDKNPDIIVLMAQGREQICIFYNRGNNNFEEKVILNFPPVYGVSYFELADFNNDGYQDILLTNGDNWDFGTIKKNYHGIRIYLNDGHDNFEKSFFYPLYGASKAMARDFDNDGDLDIAATSFYSNYEKLEQSFIYLSNDGNMKFDAYSIPEAASGKWFTMDVADFDNDGDIDIFLGSYFHTIGELSKLVSQGVFSFPQLLVLINENK